MAVPKKKKSRARRNHRRAKKKVQSPKLTECSRCNEKKIPHRICPHCGYYKGRLVR